MKSILFILLTIPVSLYCQSLSKEEQCALLLKVDRRAYEQKSPVPLDSLWATEVITDSNLVCELICQRGIQTFARAGLFKKAKIDTTTFLQLLDSSLTLLNAAVLCADGELEQLFINERYAFFQRLLKSQSALVSEEYARLYAEDFDRLRQMGLKLDRCGIGLGTSVAYTEEPWVSIKVSPSSFLDIQKKVHLSRCAGASIPGSYMKGAGSVNFLSFSMKRGLASRTNDLTFSLFDMIVQPVYLNLFEIGVKWGGTSLTKPTFHYQPSLGIGWGFISLSYAYDIMFTKEARTMFSPHVFSLSIMAPVTNRYNPKRYLK